MSTAIGEATRGGERRARREAVQRSRRLGWFSIGLGLAQLTAPRALARLIGVRDDTANRNAIRAVGVREVASGVGLLAQPHADGWLWTRVGGDVMDLALLGSAFRSRKNRSRIAAATGSVLGVTLVDLVTGRQLQRARAPRRIVRAVTINRSPQEIYRFWRHLENLPQFMVNLESVHVLGDRDSRWKARAPAGMSVEWDAEIVEDVPNERIAWRSKEGSTVAHAGVVTFAPAPGGRGTEVRVALDLERPGRALGGIVARLFGKEPGQQIAGDLRRLKQVLETGEVVHSDASGGAGLHPARPSAETP